MGREVDESSEGRAGWRWGWESGEMVDKGGRS